VSVVCGSVSVWKCETERDREGARSVSVICVKVSECQSVRVYSARVSNMCQSVRVSECRVPECRVSECRVSECQSADCQSVRV